MSPASVGFLGEDSQVEVEPKPAMKFDADRATKLQQADKATATPKKKSWWKFWGGGSKPSAAADTNSEQKEKGEDLSLPVVRRLSEKEKLQNRHNELIDSVGKVCKVLEETQDRTIEFKADDILPPIPIENLDALTKSNEQVSGVLQQVSGRLESVEKRDDLMLKSMSRVDGTMSSLQRVNEKSISTFENMQGTLKNVQGAIEDLKTESQKSSNRYESVIQKMQDQETEHLTLINKIQKRTLWVNLILGVGVIIGLIAVAVS